MMVLQEERKWLYKTEDNNPGPALSLGELGNCLRPQVEGRPQNFRKEGIEREKKSGFR